MNVIAAPTPTRPPFQTDTRANSSLISVRAVAGSDPRRSAVVDQLLETNLAVIKPATAATGNRDMNSQNAISAASPRNRLALSRVNKASQSPSFRRFLISFLIRLPRGVAF